MVKEPRCGRVKTRLARDTGAVHATAFFRENMCSTIARLSRDRRWQTILAVAPDTAVLSKMFGSSALRLTQGRGDLGDRLSRVAQHAPRGPLVIIGADIPAIRAADIADAFNALKSADAVFGPAGDGGYWLVGLRPRLRTGPVFENVRWSSVHALADTRNNIRALAVRDIDVKDDVDSGKDYHRLKEKIGRRVVGSSCKS